MTEPIPPPVHVTEQIDQMQTLAELIDNLTYAQLGAPIYKKTTGPTRVNINMPPGEGYMETQTFAPSQIDILGVVLETDTPLRYLVIGKDNSAAVISLEKSDTATKDIFGKAFSLEGSGLELVSLSKLAASPLEVSLTSYLLKTIGGNAEIILDSANHPDQIVKETNNAVVLARTKLEARRQNRDKARPGIIAALKGLF